MNLRPIAPLVEKMHIFIKNEMINMNMINDPRSWTANIKWSNFYWENNVLGIYKIISDKLLYKLTPKLIDLYSSRGYYFSSSSAIDLIEKFDSNNLLLDVEFTTRIWLVVDNFDNSTSEKLNFILNKDKFEMSFTDYANNEEVIEIPYCLQESFALKELNRQIQEIRIYIDKLILSYSESELKSAEIKNKIDTVKLEHDNIYNQYIQEEKRLEKERNQVIDINYWGNKIKTMLSAELPELDKTNEQKKGRIYHVIDVNFNGDIKIDISNKIH